MVSWNTHRIKYTVYVLVNLDLKYHNVNDQIVFNNLNRMCRQNGRVQDVDV